METIDRKRNNHAVYRDGSGDVFEASVETNNKGALMNVRAITELTPKIKSLRFRNSVMRDSDYDMSERYTTKHEKKIVVPIYAPVIVGDLMKIGMILYRVYHTDVDFRNKELYIYLENYRKLKNG